MNLVAAFMIFLTLKSKGEEIKSNPFPWDKLPLCSPVSCHSFENY
jgi:hypothetical protein